MSNEKIIGNLTNVAKEKLDVEILKSAVISELETINLFEEMAEMTRSRELRKTLLDVIRTKRMNVGEFQAHMMQLGFGPDELFKGLTNRKIA